MTFRLLVGIPSHDKWVPDFGFSLARLVAHLSKVPLAGDLIDLEISMVQGSILPESREQLVTMARMANRDLLFLDTDMGFPKNTAHILYTTNQPVVGANCVTKNLPAMPTARRNMVGSGFGEPVYTDPGSVGVEAVDHLGLAVTLIRSEVIQKILPPLFAIGWNSEHKSYRGEDWGFFRQIKAHGYQPYIHHGLSKQIMHWGYFAYNHDCVGEVVHEDVA